MILVVIAELDHGSSGLAFGEAVGDLRALGDDGRRIVLCLGGDGRLVGDSVSGGDATCGVLDGNRRGNGVLPCPIRVGPIHRVSGCVVDATIRCRDEFSVCGKRVADLDVLSLNEVEAVEVSGLSRGAVPADTGLIGVSLVDLLVAIVELVGCEAANRGVVLLTRRTSLFDCNIEVGSPLCRQRLLNRVSIRCREDDSCCGRRVVRHIVGEVAPGNLDAVRGSGRNRILEREEQALHARGAGNNVVLGLDDGVAGNRVCLIEAGGQLLARGGNGSGEPHLDGSTFTRRRNRGTGVVDSGDLLVTNG